MTLCCRPQLDEIISITNQRIPQKLKPFVMSFLSYTESNQEIVLNVQFIFILPLTAFKTQGF